METVVLFQDINQLVYIDIEFFIDEMVISF